MSVKENRIMEESEGSLLCFEVIHPVMLDSYNSIYADVVTKLYEEYGEVRLLFFYPDPDNFPGWDPQAAAEDLQNHTKRGHIIKKVALINAPAKVAQRWQLIQPLLGGPAREFGEGKFDEALEWVKS